MVDRPAGGSQPKPSGQSRGRHRDTLETTSLSYSELTKFPPHFLNKQEVQFVIWTYIPPSKLWTPVVHATQPNSADSKQKDEEIHKESSRVVSEMTHVNNGCTNPDVLIVKNTRLNQNWWRNTGALQLPFNVSSLQSTVCFTPSVTWDVWSHLHQNGSIAGRTP